MATLLAAGAASAAGYAIGSFASNSSKRGKSKRQLTQPIPPPPPLLHAPPLMHPSPFVYHPHPAAFSPYMSQPLVAAPRLPPPRPFDRPLSQPLDPRATQPRPFQRSIPPPPPLPLPRPLTAGESSRAGIKKHHDASSCAVCKQTYENGDVVARMWCKHMVHKACLENMLNSDVVEDMKCNCPHCGSKSYITRFAVAEKPEESRRANELPGMMPAPMEAQDQRMQQVPMQAGGVVQSEVVVAAPTAAEGAWDPARVSPVFFGRYQPASQTTPHPPIKGIRVTDDLSPLPASATCTGSKGCTPFFYNLRGGGPSCTLCDCAHCKQGETCEACGKCKCADCKGSACTCACQCAPQSQSSPSVSALSFSDTGSDSSYTASYASTNAPESSALYSNVTASAFQQFAYQ